MSKQVYHEAAIGACRRGTYRASGGRIPRRSPEAWGWLAFYGMNRF